MLIDFSDSGVSTEPGKPSLYNLFQYCCITLNLRIPCLVLILQAKIQVYQQ